MYPSDAGANRRSGQVRANPFSSFFGLNLIALFFIGVAISIWLLYYTDKFPEVAGILALGGAASWAGFILSLLAKRRINELQAWTDSAVLSSPFTSTVLSFLALVLIAGANFRGGIQLEPLQDSVEHSVIIHGAGEPPVPNPLRLQPGAQLHWTGWTSWWSPARVAVKVSGYPEAVVLVWPWQRIPLYIPNSFFRRVILLRPSVPLMDVVKEGSVTLELIVSDGGKQVARARTAFDGHAIWIGGDPDILVPQEIEAAWRAELTALKSARHLELLLPPLAPPEFNFSVQSGQEIDAILHKKDNSVYGTLSFKVQPLRGSREFVQEVLLDVPSAVP